MKREYIYVMVIILAMMVLVNLQYVFFGIYEKEGLVFLGRRVINSQDVYTYLSYIEQSKQGAWLLENLYTTESQYVTLVRPSYIIIGKLAKLLDISSLYAYHGARIVLIAVFCISLYGFIRRVFEKESHRFVAFIIVLFSSGLGFLLGGTFTQSADLWIPEANTFMMLGESPHFILSQTLMLLGFMMFLAFIEKKNVWFAVATCVCFVPLAFEHPFDLFVICLALFLLAVWCRGVSMVKILFICLISAVGLLYPFFELKMNSIYALEQAQGASISPPPTNYLVGFGFLVFLALIGAEKFLQQSRDKFFPNKKNSVKLVLLWVGVGVMLLYAPVTFQRRMSEGLHIPVAILASVGLIMIFEVLKKRIQQLAVPVFVCCILILSIGSWRTMWEDFVVINNDTLVDYYYYYSIGDAKGIEWLKDNTEQTDIVLSNWFYGNLIPGKTGRKVYLGHKAQTIDIENKIKLTNVFLLDENTESAVRFLKQNRIAYIFLGTEDTMLNYGFKPDEKEYLNKVYDQRGVRVYRVEE